MNCSSRRSHLLLENTIYSHRITPSWTSKRSVLAGMRSLARCVSGLKSGCTSDFSLQRSAIPGDPTLHLAMLGHRQCSDPQKQEYVNLKVFTCEDARSPAIVDNLFKILNQSPGIARRSSGLSHWSKQCCVTLKSRRRLLRSPALHLPTIAQNCCK